MGAIRDVDSMTNHGNPKELSGMPHEHIWQYGTKWQTRKSR